ncbi:Rha family transcriptional regulator [Crassaminicella thermophila]|nr:Rha family transcriptional regulator [Crassaminicella thermophila]
MNFLQLNEKEVTMTSLEVAKITSKKHKNVIRDIKNEIEQLENKGLRAELIFELSEYKDATGRKLPCYKLNKKGVMQIGARYDAAVRYRLIDYVEKLSEIKTGLQLNNNSMIKLENFIEDKLDEKIEKLSQLVRPSSRQKASVGRYIKRSLGIERTNEEYELVKQRVLIILGGTCWEDIPAETLAENMAVIDESIKIVKADRKVSQLSMFEMACSK